MMPECNLQIELFPDIALSRQVGPAGMGNIGGAGSDFREGFVPSAAVLCDRLLRCGAGDCDRHRLRDACLCVSQLFS